MRRFVARHGGAFTPAAHFERPSHLPVSPMKTFLGVKLALLPFVLFWTAAGFGAARTGAAAGAVLAGALIAWRLATRGPTLLEAVGAVVLAGIALVPAGAGFAPGDGGVAASFVVLGLACAASVVLGRPWTSAYARSAWAGASGSALFERVNRVLSGLWAALFVYAGLARGFELSPLLAWAPFALGVVASILGPRAWVARALSRSIAQREPNPWQAPDFSRADGARDAVVVVGAGLGGLVAGALLADAGLRVVVAEHHDRPGGFAHTWLRKGRDGDARPVFRFDSGVHDVSGVRDGAPVGGILRRLGIEDQVAWTAMSRREIGPDGAHDVPSNWDAYVDQLARRFPAESGALRATLADVMTIFTSMYANAPAASGIPGAPATVEGLLDYARAHPLAVRWLDRPFAEFVGQRVRDPAAIAAIGALSGYLTDDASTLTVAQMVPLFGYPMHGGHYPVGGSGALADALVAAIEARGGTVRLKTAVERVIVEGGEARGVVLAGGERIDARAVVVNADFIDAATRLVDPDCWPAPFREALAAVRPACSAFMVHLGVRGGFPGARPLTRVVTPAGGVEVVLPSVADPSAAPDGYATLELIRLVDPRAAAGWFDDERADARAARAGAGHDDPARRASPSYRARKAALGDEMIAIAESAFPGLSSRIVVRCDASPLTFRRYAWSSAGSIYGASAPATLRATKSPIRGLVFAGAHTHGPGVEAVFISGARAAQAIVPGVLAARAGDAEARRRSRPGAPVSEPPRAPRRPVATARS